MSSRKELLKKSLGIREYPWSSDDDLDEPSTSTAPDVSAMRHSDHRPANDIPGPSGLQHSLSTPDTRRQAKFDRDLFWSILNSPCNPIKIRPPPPPLPSPVSTPRKIRLDAAIPGRLMHAPGADHHRSTRGNNVPDVQRILAFKRLTRNINVLRHSSCPSGRSNSNSCPNVPSELSGLRANRGHHHIGMRNFPPSRSLLRNASSNFVTMASNNNAESDEMPIALTTRSRYRGREGGTAARETGAGSRDVPLGGDLTRNSPTSPTSPSPHIQLNINLRNDDEDIGPFTSQSILADEVNLIQDDPSDIEILGNNTSALSLEEEIVEIADDTAPLPPPSSPAPLDLDDKAPNLHEHHSDPNLASTSSQAVVEPTNLPSKQGTKRKRQDSDDNLEPYTVKEFNQELLRLLECPVCLEWMEPPMSQCRRGHLVCGRCRARLNACPICRTTFSSVRNRAMEGVAEMLRYPCRHGCGREVRLRRRAPHEASCALRKYQCPAPACCQHAAMPRQMLAEHFQSKHLPMLKIGGRHKFSIKMSAEQHDNWIILAMDEYFHLRIDVDIRVFVYVAYIGPKCDAKNFTYEVTVEGQHHSRKLIYARSTHCDLESPSVNVSREDCFSLSLDQALNFIRFKNRHYDDKYLDFNVEITKIEPVKDESDS